MTQRKPSLRKCALCGYDAEQHGPMEAGAQYKADHLFVTQHSHGLHQTAEQIMEQAVHLLQESVRIARKQERNAVLDEIEAHINAQDRLIERATDEEGVTYLPGDREYRAVFLSIIEDMRRG